VSRSNPEETEVKKLQKATLLQMRDQLASFDWTDEELDELVEPRLGIITAFQRLLDDLEKLRAIDLGTVPPNEPLTRAAGK
jgi:hypothetical protein